MLEDESILRVAEQEWRQLVRRDPALTPAIAVQRRVVTRVLHLTDVVTQTLPARIELDPARMGEKLDAGTPLFLGEPIPVDGTPLVPFAVGFCDDLATGHAGRPAARLARALGDGSIDVGSLVSASLGRQQEAIRTKAHHLGVSPDLLWLIAELTAGSTANRLQAGLLEARGNDPTSGWPSCWSKGFCAACGSWPAFAERRSETPTRWLRCSFCGARWQPASACCVYCQAAGDSFITAAENGEPSHRHLELCRECGGYLKSIRVSLPTPFALLPVMDLGTSDLDLEAVGRGYRRLPMVDFPASGAAPCPGFTDL